MNEGNLGNIIVVLADPKPLTRNLMRGAMNASGYRDVRDCTSVKNLETMLMSNLSPDLVIVDAALSGGNAFELIRSLRMGELGDNPFIPVIMVCWNASSEMIGKAAGCGVDDILVAPISPADLFARIKVLIRNRKPFVVTSDYIGPDRRYDPARGKSDIPQIEVPNTLRLKVLGQEIDDTDIKSAISQALNEINDQRLVRHSYQISYLVGLILPAYQENKVDPAVRIHVRNLSEVADEVGGRLVGSQFEHVGELCQTMRKVVASIRENWREPSRKDVELLEPLSQAILAGFNPDRDSAEMAGEINSMVSQFSGAENETEQGQVEESGVSSAQSGERDANA
jgi:DNA-binding response OmpR family regulator